MKQKQRPARVEHRASHIIIVAIIGLFIVGSLYWFVHKPEYSGLDEAMVVNHDQPAKAANNSSGAQPRLKNAIIVTDQKAGSSVDIDQVTLQNPGFVVIHEVTADGKPGAIIAHSGWLSAGTKQDLLINLRTKANTRYVAMLHNDDGDKKFEAAKDQPILNAQAMPVMTMFTVK